MSLFLVTGGAGFVGSKLSIELISQGHDVVVVDDLSTGFVENIHSNSKFIKGNLSNQETIIKLKKFKFDSIFHIAGQSRRNCFENPVVDLNSNVKSTINLLKYSLDSNCKNFIYASTMSVYGSETSKEGLIGLTNEDQKCNPKSFYAVGKLASEMYLKIYSSFGIKCTALRLFNVYGEGQNMKNMKQGMASIFLGQAINNSSILVKGSKDRFRDFVVNDSWSFILINNYSKFKF